MKKKLISFGLPCYNEEENIFRVYTALKKLAITFRHKYDVEFVFVDNGSLDNTRREIEAIVKIDKRVKGVFLSRNFGPEASGQAVLDHAKGDAFIFYESDMQDPISVIPKFIKQWEEGYDAVIGVRNKIEDTPLMTLARKSFYQILKKIANIDIPVNAGSFALLSRRVVIAINNLPEKYRFHRGLRAWVGFKTAFIQYERQKRIYGKSSYNLYDYFKHAERSFFGFSYIPLDLIVTTSLILVLLSFMFLVTYLLYVFLFRLNVNPITLLIAIIVFFGGIQLLAISFLGKYIQVIVEETKARPIYIVEDIVSRK